MTTKNHEILKDLSIFFFLGVIVVLKFWNFLIPNNKIFFAGDFVVFAGMRDYFYDQLRNGFLILWDTHLGTGMPYLGGDLGAFYPIDLITGLFFRYYDIIRLQVLMAVHYWMAGVFMYLYVRQLGFYRVSAIVSALSFMMGGFLLANPHHRDYIQTFIWLPLVLYFLDKALIQRKKIWSLFSGLFLAFSYLAGHANIFYYLLLFLLFYYCFRIYLGIRAQSYKNILQDSTYFLIMGFFCMGCSSLQLLPLLAAGAGTFRDTMDFDWAIQGSYPLINLITLLMPKGIHWTATDLSDQLSYVGMLPLLLGFWAVLQPNEIRTKFWGLVALFSMLMAFGANTPFFKILYDLLPGLHLFRIPARSNSLLTFALAILAGYGCNYFFRSPFQEGLRRLQGGTKKMFTFSLAGGILVGLVSLFWKFHLGGDGSLPELWGQFEQEYILFLMVLGAAYLIISGRTQGFSQNGLKWAIVLSVSLDLWLVSLNFGPNIGGHMSIKDPAIPSEQAMNIALELRKDQEIFRISNTEGLLPHHLRYQEGLTTYDVSSMPDCLSTQFPMEYLNLNFLLRKNQRLFDLLNVKYHIGGKEPDISPLPATIQMGATAGTKEEFQLNSSLPLSTLSLQSFLSYSELIPQGESVAQIILHKTDGSQKILPIRAGIETSEWAIDRPGTHFLHRKAQVVESKEIIGEGYQGHDYKMTFDFPSPLVIEKISLQYLESRGILEIKKISINQKPLGDSIKKRFELVAPGIYKNNSAFPRVFTIAKAKVVPSEKRMIEEIKLLDPKEYVLLDRLPAGYKDPSDPSFSTQEAKIVRYSPHRILIETRTESDKFLVLSDTYSPYWKARVDQKSAPMLRADYGLRGLYVPKGHHQVEFYLYFYPFYYGLFITCISMALFLILFIKHLTRDHKSELPK
jgi:hypothetical protein